MPYPKAPRLDQEILKRALAIRDRTPDVARRFRREILS